MKIYLLPLVLATFLLSCSKEAEDKQVINLAGEFIINADQILTAAGPIFGYRIETVNNQDCLSSDILYTLIDEEGELNLTIEDISEVENCPSNEGKVVENIPLHIETGNTNIAISLRDIVKNKGSIQTNSIAYKLTIPEAEGILLGNLEVMKLPEDVIFGTLIAEDLESTIIRSFLDSLQEFSVNVLPDGYYTNNFSVENGQAIVSGETNLSDVHQDVYFRVEDKEAFQNFILSYKENHTSLALSLIDAATGEYL